MRPRPLELGEARGIHMDPEPDERGQVFAAALIKDGRMIALTLNVN